MLNGWRLTKLCSLEPDSSLNPSAWDVATCNSSPTSPHFWIAGYYTSICEGSLGTDHSCALGRGWRYIARCKRWNFGCTAQDFCYWGVSLKFKGKGPKIARIDLFFACRCFSAQPWTTPGIAGLSPRKIEKAKKLSIQTRGSLHWKLCSRKAIPFAPLLCIEM